MTEISRHPLTWPVGWPRTPALHRKKARFDTPFGATRDHLLNELKLLKAGVVIVISSNVPLRQDGLPYANFREPIDPGVAVYFRLKGKSHVLACDKWERVQDNLRAIGLHIAAIRSIERYGVGSVEQAFMGYQSLPPSPTNDSAWWDVLNVKRDASLDEIKAAYLQKARSHHPDVGGSAEEMAAINRAWEMAQKERG